MHPGHLQETGLPERERLPARDLTHGYVREPRRGFGAPAPEPGRPQDVEPPATTEEPEPLQEWRAAAGPGGLVGVALSAVLAVVTVFCASRLLGASGAERLIWGAVTLVAGAALGYVLYLLRGLSRMRYILGPRSITVECLAAQRTVPYDTIVDVVYKPHERAPASGWERYWPGFYVSTTRMVDGVWHSWATLPPHRRVRIVTETDIVAISPHRPILFLDELHRRLQGVTAPPTESRIPETGQPRPTVPAAGRAPARIDPIYVWNVLFREQLLGDHVASALIAAGVVIPLLMAGYLYSQYEGIPGTIPLHYNARGEVDAYGTPRDLWLLPVVAAVVLVVNTAIATAAQLYDRFVSRLLLAAIPGVQALAFIALLRLMNAG